MKGDGTNEGTDHDEKNPREQKQAGNGRVYTRKTRGFLVTVI